MNKFKIQLTFLISFIFLIACTNGERPFSFSLSQGTGGASVTCTGKICLAVGEYLNTGFKIAPLLAFSNDGGMTYTSTNAVPLPSDTRSVLLNGITCTGKNCLIVGSYTSTTGVQQPLVVMSNNGGESYGNPIAVPLPDDAILGIDEHALLGNIICSAKSCSAVGAYASNNSAAVPLLVFSNDGGKTFTSSNAVTLPNNASTGMNAGALLFGISCSGQNCLSVGLYLTNNCIGPVCVVSPLIAFSNNGGKSYTSINTIVPLPPNAAIGVGSVATESAIFYSVTCSGTNCMAVGAYTTDKGTLAPLLSYSKDGGKNYTTSSTVSPPSDARNGIDEIAYFTGITCTGKSCIAVGTYLNNIGEELPFWAASADGGTTFKTYTNSSAASLPSDSNVPLFAAFGFSDI